MVLMRERTLPRLGDPKTILALAVLVLAAAAIKAEVWPDLKTPPSMAETRLLVQQGKMVGPDTENAPSPQEECPDANPVWKGVGTGDLETDLFETRTDRFVVSYEVLERRQQGVMPSLYATVEDEDGRSISSGTIPSPQPGDPVRKDLTPNMGRTIVDAEPGSYRLDVSPSKSDRRYALTVEECGVPSSGEA
jgi:hypothetical protein